MSALCSRATKSKPRSVRWPRQEQRAFRWFAVFIGGSTLDAALAVLELPAALDVLTDVDVIMRDNTDAPVLVTPNGQLAGLTAIRGFFSQFIASSPPELLTAITLTHQEL